MDFQVPSDFTTDLEEQKVVFRPNPGPQTDFLAAPQKQVLYGGAAGGEPKSWFYRLLSQQCVKINIVNCWKPEKAISIQAPQGEGSEAIPKGSRGGNHRLEARCPATAGEDMVQCKIHTSQKLKYQKVEECNMYSTKPLPLVAELMWELRTTLSVG